MTVQTHLLNQSGLLTPYLSMLNHQLTQALTQIEQQLPLGQIDLTVAPCAPCDQPSYGIGGFTAGPHRVELSLDWRQPELTKQIEQQLPAVLAHELHHAQRMALGHFGNDNFADLLIMEGLACHFERTVNGDQLPSLFADIRHHDWQPLWQKMQPLLAHTHFDSGLLMLGSDPSQYPKYAGYWVGYQLVKSHLQRNQLTDAEAIKLPASAFF